jgi:hypothetical protein
LIKEFMKNEKGGAQRSFMTFSCEAPLTGS